MIGIIAGNKLLPLILAKKIKENSHKQITAICFKGETSPQILNYVDKVYWLEVGQLATLRNTIQNSKVREWIFSGQISPWRIFKKDSWDDELTKLIEVVTDIRPHTIFGEIIKYLEQSGATFLDSTIYLKDILAGEGNLNGLTVDSEGQKDIDFGVSLISKFVELDVGQTIVVKKRSALALETLEGTDNTIRRGYKIGGTHCTILKFCKSNQDLRFDIPVVGLTTLKLLKKIKAKSLILEKDKALILEKDKFFYLANKWAIPIIGKKRA